MNHIIDNDYTCCPKLVDYRLDDNVKHAIDTLSNGTHIGRSFYLYDTSVMVNKLCNLKATLPHSVLVYYALKANPHAAFLKAARDGGATGIEIASVGEGRKALKAGFRPQEIIFTGPGKSHEDLLWSVEKGIGKVHVESLTEAHRLNSICADLGARQDILVRVNPNFHIHGAQVQFSGESSKMGVDEDFFRNHLDAFLAFESLDFKGLHVYAASGVLEVTDLIQNCRKVFELVNEIENANPAAYCEVVDFGGGFGIDYTGSGRVFSVEGYAKELEALTKTHGLEDRTFVLELGRYLAADSGWYCTEILDIKDSMGKLQVVCHGGAHHFRRPAALKINHPVSIVAKNRPKIFNGQVGAVDSDVFFGGPLCNSADKLAAYDVFVARAEIGDIAVFSLAGAYGLTMSHVNFLSHDQPQELLITQA